jgi:hypothetical protein
MNASEYFKYLLSKKICAFLKGHKFIRKGNTYIISEMGNYGILNFQKSIKSTKEKFIFTINIGVISKKIYDVFAFEMGELKPDIVNCQWQTRLVSSYNEDDWWVIDPDTSFEKLEKDLLVRIANYGIPEIESHMNDSFLRDLWLSEKSPSLTKFQRLLYLLAFLKDLGPQDKIEPTIKELIAVSKNQPTSTKAYFYIEKLFPDYPLNSV